MTLRQTQAIYSPHTAWDAIEGGINDWMLSAFGSIRLRIVILRKVIYLTFKNGLETKRVVPIEMIAELPSSELTKSLKVNVDFGPSKDKLISKASSFTQSVRYLDEKK